MKPLTDSKAMSASERSTRLALGRDLAVDIVEEVGLHIEGTVAKGAGRLGLSLSAPVGAPKSRATSLGAAMIAFTSTSSRTGTRSQTSGR